MSANSVMVSADGLAAMMRTIAMTQNEAASHFIGEELQGVKANLQTC